MQPTHITVQGGSMTAPGGAIKPQDFPRHRDGAREAGLIAKRMTKGGPTAGFRPTANVIVALDFENAEVWHSIVDPAEAMAEDLANAATPAQIQRLQSRSDAKVVEDHTEAVRVQRVDHPVTHRGKTVPTGSFVVVNAAREVDVYTAAEIVESYRAPTKVAAKGSKV